ncbi:MAG TPA: hypothetical protein ENF61_02665 [Firmicutes bacterium]|nr:hypothetical protein [Bacillota bacterium]
MVKIKLWLTGYVLLGIKIALTSNFQFINVSVFLHGYSVSGNLYYRGTLSGNVHVEAYTSSDFQTQPFREFIINDFSSGSSYTLEDFPAGNYWIVAFMDINQNNEYDKGEPYGEYIFNPLTISGQDISGIDINLNSPPSKPSCLQPPDHSTTENLDILLVSSQFSDADGTDTQTASKWEIFLSEQNETDTPVFEREITQIDIEQNPSSSYTSLKIPWGTLEFGKEYKWRVKYRDFYGMEWSEWSDFSFFTTCSYDPDLDEQIPDETVLTQLQESYQVDIGIKTINGETVGVKTDTGIIKMLKSINPDTLPDDGKPDNLPFGLFATRIENLQPGQRVTVSFYLPGNYENPTWYKYDPVKGWYEFGNVSFTYDSANRYTEASLILKDGETGDVDGVANGIIIDPGGVALFYQKGDINRDWQIDISDVILCLRMCVGIDPVDLSKADINSDGRVDISDVILTLRLAIGLPVE